jgi:hypothetical protein
MIKNLNNIERDIYKNIQEYPGVRVVDTIVPAGYLMHAIFMLVCI